MPPVPSEFHQAPACAINFAGLNRAIADRGARQQPVAESDIKTNGLNADPAGLWPSPG
jgi:hypothetical protein